MRRLVVLAALVTPLAFAAVAVATPPTVETMTVHRQFVAGTCGTFDVIAEFYAERRVTTFYDQDGNPTRRLIQAQIPGTLTNSVTGKTLTTFGKRVIWVDPVTNALISSTGTNVHVVVPGMGTVMIGAGHFGIDDDGQPFAEGRLDPPITEALCEALAAA